MGHPCPELKVQAARESGHARNPKITGFYILAAAPVAARLFLPLEDDTGQLMSWHEAIELIGRDEPLDAQTEWAEVSALPPSGGFAPLSGFDPSPGQIPSDLLELLTAVLGDIAGSDTSWVVERADPFRYPPGSETSLTAPAMAGDQRDHAEDGPQTGDAAGDELVVQGLDLLVRPWRIGPFPGRVHDVHGTVGLAAPPYADSLYVSGPTRLIEGLSQGGAELAAVNGRDPLPNLAR